MRYDQLENLPLVIYVWNIELLDYSGGYHHHLHLQIPTNIPLAGANAS
jgi:hypothetical protein